MGVYLSKCWAATGQNPIAVRWVDIRKGDVVNPDYRSRLVAKDVKTTCGLSYTQLRLQASACVCS